MTSEQINLAVAAIAGWTDIIVWQPERDLPVKTYQGTNPAHPECGTFVPDYINDLNAIILLLESLNIYPVIDFTDDRVYYGEYIFDFSQEFEVALALCRLLIAINPTPIAPIQVAIIDDDGEIESVFEAEFE